MVQPEGHPGMGPVNHTSDTDPSIQLYGQAFQGIIHHMNKIRTMIPMLLELLHMSPAKNSSHSTGCMRYVYTPPTKPSQW